MLILASTSALRHYEKLRIEYRLRLRARTAGAMNQWLSRYRKWSFDGKCERSGRCMP
jgi:hypothetical protein